MGIDPRIASATVTDGPPELVGDELVIVTPVVIDGTELHLPKALPGVLEYVTVVHAEKRANELRDTLLEGLDYRGSAPYQPDATRTLEFLASGGTAVATAVTGLEAFANHQLASFCPPQLYDASGEPAGSASAVLVFGEELTFRDLTNRTLDERLGNIIPELKGSDRPTSQPWWPKLRQVQALAALNRHGITDRTSRKGLVGIKSLVQRLCDREYAGAAAMMLKVFEFISPTWVDAQRALELPNPPEG